LLLSCLPADRLLEMTDYVDLAPNKSGLKDGKSSGIL